MFCSLLFFHGRYISLLSPRLPSPPSNEPPFSARSSPHPHRQLSFMAAFPHNHSSLVFKTPPSDHDHPATHHVLAAPVSLPGHGLFVSPISLLSSITKTRSNSASSRNHPSTTATTTTTPGIPHPSPGRVARFPALPSKLCLGPEATDAPSRQCAI